MYQPSYLKSAQTGKLEIMAQSIQGRMADCDLCPRNCGVNRLSGEIGHCGVGKNAWISSYGPHHGEENPLRGWGGSGTIFFSGCNLNCIYCQNADISQRISGREVSPEQLAEMMVELQAMGCHNINLVSPSHVVGQIVQAVVLAADQGLMIPIVYNSGGYDSLDTIKALEGMIDIYMPDMKYDSSQVSSKLSGVDDYPAVNRAAVREMHRQVGDLRMDQKGVAERGLLIRHLILPENLAGSAGILHFLAEQISNDTYLNLMDQYHPAYMANTCPKLMRKITSGELQEVVQIAKEVGLNRLDKRW